MSDAPKRHLSTRVIHAGQHPDAATGAVSTPIYQTSTFAFTDADQGAARFSGADPGCKYTRLGNPTVAALEACVADLEGGCGALGAATRVRVLRTSATTGEGVAGLVDALEAHAAEAGVGRRRRAAAIATRPDDALAATLRDLARRDPFQRHNGIEFVAAAPGTATMRMRVAKPHLNFNGKCHGGEIFSLADSAFGMASNSHGVVAVGIDTHTTFQVAASEGDVLTARATEVSRNAKLAVYRVDATRGDGALVSSFTGTVYMTRPRLTALVEFVRPEIIPVPAPQLLFSN